MLTDSVPLSYLISQGILVGGTGWSDTDYFGTQVVKGITVKQVKKNVIKTENEERGKITLDEAKLVQLGGAFQETGGKDEVVGGGSQKVGSDNQ